MVHLTPAPNATELMLLIKTCRTIKTKSVRVVVDQKGHFLAIKHPTDCDNYSGIAKIGPGRAW